MNSTRPGDTNLPSPRLLSAKPTTRPEMTEEQRRMYAGEDPDEVAAYFDDVDTVWADRSPAGSTGALDETAVIPVVGDGPDAPPPGPPGYPLASPDPEYPENSGLPGWLKILLAIFVSLAILGGAAFAGIFLLGGGSDTGRERTVTTESSESDDTAAGGGYATREGMPEPEDSTPTDPMFSWWGDRLSANAVRYSPAIGITGHAYFWHADEEIVSAAEVINSIERVRIAEESGDPDPDMGTLGGTVVFAFGNTEDIGTGTLEALRTAVGPDRTLVLVGVGALNNRVQPWRAELNARYGQFAEDNVNTRYVDWQSEVDSNPGYVNDSGNLTQSGTSAWANLVNREIKDVYS
ncbi:hypothetical protein [Corynebacterium sp. AOP12-C2-36]|uniref:hypothetical protein n=1 Tax=Corynebacterium sp. AOP12-C2-36 TaxID=3457723 RepID=UPI0040344A64